MDNCAHGLVSASDFLHLIILDPSVMMMIYWEGGAPLALHLCEGQLVSICLVHVSFVPNPFSTTILPWRWLALRQSLTSQCTTKKSFQNYHPIHNSKIVMA
jgi:hypothetical protein